MLVLYIPMVCKANLLDLYGFLQLPIHFNYAMNISVTLDVGATNLLTIGHSKSFQTISSSDLHSCLHLGDTFFCKGRKMMETSLKRSCLGALYLANFGSNSIQLLVQNCRSQRENLCIIQEHLGSVLHQHYQHQRGLPAKNNVTALQIQSGDTIRVNPGCYIRMIDHVISADESEII
jgi:hypothetical protein